MNWLPIETAPTDTPILVTNGEIIVVCKSPERMIGNLYFTYPKPVGFDGYEWDWHFEWKDLTHWMPLPQPPKDSNEKA